MGFGWVRVPEHVFKSQSEINSFIDTSQRVQSPAPDCLLPLVTQGQNLIVLCSPSFKKDIHSFRKPCPAGLVLPSEYIQNVTTSCPLYCYPPGAGHYDLLSGWLPLAPNWSPCPARVPLTFFLNKHLKFYFFIWLQGPSCSTWDLHSLL